MMAWFADWRAHKLVKASGHDTDVFMAIRRLMGLWREDPDKLAVAATAYEMLGYTMAAYELEAPDLRRPDGRFLERWSQEMANAAIHDALYRRNRRILRARAYGLLLALTETAADAERALLHDIEVDAAIIECRQLSREERFDRLRSRSVEP